MAAKTILLPEQAFVGFWLKDKSQIFQVVSVRPYMRRDRQQSYVLLWKASCADCENDFFQSTGMVVSFWRRRCDHCKAPGRPAFGRIRKGDNRSDEELKRVRLFGSGDEQMDAHLELQRRRQQTIRKLRWAMKNAPTAAEQMAARAELRKMRVVPEPTIRRKKAAEPAVSIFD